MPTLPTWVVVSREDDRLAGIPHLRQVLADEYLSGPDPALRGRARVGARVGVHVARIGLDELQRLGE